MKDSENRLGRDVTFDVDFRGRFDELIREREAAYPAAAAYLRSSEMQHVTSVLGATLARVEGAVRRDDAYWRRFDQVISDISRVLGIPSTSVAGFAARLANVPRRDFECIRKRLYGSAHYPVSEHLFYIDFPPALERQAYLAEQLPKTAPPHGVICDLGSGPGVLFALALQSQSLWRGCAVDVSPECARYARRLSALKGVDHRADFLVADVRRLPYPDGSFDVVIGTEILEHVPDPRTAMREAVRVLRGGGHAVLSAPVGLDVGMHLHVFRSSEDVRDLYEGSGLQILDFREMEFTVASSPFVDTFALARKRP